MRILRSTAGALAGLWLSGAVGSMADPHADIAQALGLCAGAAIAGALFGWNTRGGGFDE